MSMTIKQWNLVLRELIKLARNVTCYVLLLFLSSYHYITLLSGQQLFIDIWVYECIFRCQIFNILQVKLDTSIYISIYTYIYSNLRGPIGTSPYGLARYWAGLGPPSPCLISIAHTVMDSFEAKSNEEILDHELYDVLVQSCNLLSKEKIPCREAP
jgi:hypothetical protein